jgi:predicted TIM-barrel fold metal-dependent hydrolase
MDEHDVAAASVVQRGHLYGYDNSLILDSAAQYPGRLLPVVILDPQDPRTPARFAEMVTQRGVRGFRMAAARPGHLDTAWMASPQAMELWRTCADLNVPMTLIFFYHHLPFALPLLKVIARRFPSLPILIDHLGTAYGVSVPERSWSRDAGFDEIPTPPAPHYGIDETIRIFEDMANVYFKLTEVNFECFHAAGVDGARVLRRMADGFGAHRLLWGSDVGQSVRWSYAEKATMGRAVAAQLTAAERSQFLHDNAARLYVGAAR